MSFEIFNDNYLINSMIIGALQKDEITKDGVIRYPQDRYEKIPWINFPGCSSHENFNIVSMAKQVLIESFERKDLQYGEVSISFNEKAEISSKNDCVIVYGTYDRVDFYKNEKIRELIETTDTLSIVSLHNHPNDTPASLLDMFVFASTPKLHIMETIHPSGNIDVLFRHYRIPLIKECADIIVNVVPDIFSRIKNPDEDIFSCLTKDESKLLKANFLKLLKDNGVSYCENISQKNVKEAESYLNKEFAKNIGKSIELNVKKTIEDDNVSKTFKNPAFFQSDSLSSDAIKEDIEEEDDIDPMLQSSDPRWEGL